MATYIITLTTAGTDTGPFFLYSDVDDYTAAFAGPISRVDMLAGYPLASIPIGTLTVKVQSIGGCPDYIGIPVPPPVCYKYLPDDDVNTYLVNYEYLATQTYAYGPFTSYDQGGVPFISNRIIRLNPNLTADATFVTGTGFNQVLFSGSAVKKQPDSKLIVTGSFTTYNGTAANRIIRLNPNGSVDGTFVYGSGFNNFAQTPYITGTGHIYVPGFFTTYNGLPAPRIARLQPGGLLDPAFVMGAGFANTTLDVIENPDGSIWVIHYGTTWKGVFSGNGLAKILANGNVDPSFVPIPGSPAGGFFPFVPNNSRYIARITGESSFYVAGYFTSFNGVAHGHIIKLTVNGLVDGTFNAGTGFNGNVDVVSLVWGDKILCTSLIAGGFTSYNGAPTNKLIILNANGTVLYSPGATQYFTPTVIGDTLFGKLAGGCLQPLFSHI